MPAKTEPLFHVRMEAADAKDGRPNRTIELRAKDKDAARRLAERQADDVAAEHGGDPYVIVKVEAVK